MLAATAAVPSFWAAVLLDCSCDKLRGPISCNKLGSAQNKWAVPVSGGVAKIFKDGGQLMQLSVQYCTRVTRPLTFSSSFKSRNR
jgi:hypothetical protein